MLYVRVMFVDKSDNVFFYKLPESLTDEDINWYFKSYLNLKGKWKLVNDVKLHRSLSRAKYNVLFATEQFNRDVEMMREYYGKLNTRCAIWVQMRVFGCRYLYSKGMIMEDIANVLGYKNHSSVNYNVTKYRDFSSDLKYSEFMTIIKNGEYPRLNDGKVEFIKL